MHSKHLVQLLLPFLKRLNDEQMKELEFEAKRQGMFDLFYVMQLSYFEICFSFFGH